LAAVPSAIAFASCADYNAPDQRAFDAIAAEKPILFIHTGDLHYHDTNSTVVDDYRANYDSVLNQPNQAALFRSVPLAYMWDDHDFGGNDSDSTFVGQDAARAAYKERVPHYPIASTAGGTMAQSFTIGRVRVIMTDLRSAADAPTKKDNASKTHLGTAQKNWFKQELISARDAGFPLILWVCSNPWIGELQPTVDIDNWASYQTERAELANFMRDNRITNVALLCGDMHALAYDDGSHSDYATGGGAPLTVLQAASLTQGGSVKGDLTAARPAGHRPIRHPRGLRHRRPERRLPLPRHARGRGDEDELYFQRGQRRFPAAQAFVNISTLAPRVLRQRFARERVCYLRHEAPQRPRRAVGPTLAQFGVADALTSPALTVFQNQNGKSVVIASNSGWGAASASSTTLLSAGVDSVSAGDNVLRLNSAFDRTGAFRLDPSSNDAAFLLTLQPGSLHDPGEEQDRRGRLRPLLEVYDVP